MRPPGIAGCSNQAGHGMAALFEGPFAFPGRLHRCVLQVAGADSAVAI
jgi:hypothetical protein